MTQDIVRMTSGRRSLEAIVAASGTKFWGAFDRAWPTFVMLLLLAVVVAPGWASTRPPNAFYVAPNGRDTWSGRLPAPNADSSDGPFATLPAAQSAMRASTGGRLTYVRQGVYFLAAPLHFGETDSGEQIMAYPDEVPMLYGGLPAKGWRGTDGSFAVPAPLTIDKDVGLPLLISSGQRLPIARYPPIGSGDNHESAWLFADSNPDGIDAHRSFRVRAGDIDAVAAAAQSGAFITIFGRRGWQNYVFAVDHVDRATRIVTLNGSAWDALGEGSRFAVLNAAMTPGTWRFDQESTTFRLRSSDAAPVPSDPVPSDIVAASLPCIMLFEHVRDMTVTGLHLVGTASEGAAFCLSQTERIGLDRLVIRNTGDGIRLDHATDTRLTDSEISGTAGSGIILRGDSNGTTVVGNWFHDIGWLHQDASAIWFDGSSRNRFAQNRIENVAKFGIGGGSLTEGGAYDNLIENNEIDHANQRTSDGGAIMIIDWAQDATRTTIRGNLVTGTTALGNTGWDGKPHITFQDPLTHLVSQAIYLDDWASGVLVSGNLLCGNVGGIDLHAGWDNRVVDNVLIDNAGIALTVDADNWLGAGAHPHPMEHNIIAQNTIVLDRPSTGQSGATAVRGGPIAAQFDNNAYAGGGLNGYSFHHEPDHLWSDYSFGIDAWRQRGQDTHAVAGKTVASMAIRDGAVQAVGSTALPHPISLDAIGRPQDRAGLADRVRRACSLQ
jgi:hypothetical protein